MNGPGAGEGEWKVARALCSTDVSSANACLNVRRADLPKRGRRYESEAFPGARMIFARLQSLARRMGET